MVHLLLNQLQDKNNSNFGWMRINLMKNKNKKNKLLLD